MLRFPSGAVHAALVTLLAFAPVPALSQESAPADTAVPELDPAHVTGTYRPLAPRESDQVARIPLRNLENPQAYTIVSKELIKQQLGTDYNSAFKNVAGASKASQYMQGQSHFYTRGFSSSANEMRNGFSTNVVTEFDPVNVERIEAVRGPGGALFGAGAGTSYGGFFNRVTKAPLPTRHGEASYSGGSWNLSRLTADVNTPLREDKSVLLRLNLARHVEGSWMDQGFTDAWVIAPVLSYQVSDRLKLTLDAEFYRRTGTSVPQMWVSGTTARSIEDLGFGYRRSFLDNSLATETRTQNVFVRADYRLTDSWSSETVAAATSSASDLKSIYLGIFDDSLAVRWYDMQAWKVYTRQFQQNVRGEFSTARMRHQALAGFGAGTQDYSWPYIVAMDTVNYVNPGADYFVGADIYSQRIAAAGPLNLSLHESYNYNAYAADAIHYDRYTLLIGARWDFFDNRGSDEWNRSYRQHAISPRVGAVVQPWKDRVALYANAMTGYRNVTGRTADGTAIVPERALQLEGGVKIMTPGGLFAGTFSVYDIEVRDVLRADTIPGMSLQDGNQRSRGFEAEIAAHPLEGLSAVAGYSFNRSRLVKADAEVEGLRPPGAGPAQAANFWISYETPAGPAKGLGAGFGANHASEAYHAHSASYVFTVPAYTLWDATVFYNQPRYRVGVKLDNLTDRKYWSPEGLQAGAPRRVIGDVTYRF